MRVSVYRPQLRVPVYQAAEVPQLDVSSGVMKLAEEADQFARRAQSSALTDAELGMAEDFAALRDELRTVDWREKESTFEKRAAAIRKSRVDASRDGWVRQQATESYRRQFLAQQDHVRQDAFEAQSSFEVGRMNTALDMLAKEAAAARSPDERRIALENGAKTVANTVRGGFLDEGRGESILAKFRGDADLFTGRTLIDKDPWVARRTFGSASAWQKLFPHLDPLQAQSLHNAADAEATRRENEARARAALERSEHYEEAAGLAKSDIQSRLQSGAPIGDVDAQARIRRGFTDKQWAAYQADAQEADALYKATGHFQTMPTAQLRGEVEKLRPKGGEADYAERFKAYTRAAAIEKQIVSQRDSDPVSAMRRSFPQVQSAWRIFEANPHPAHLRDAIKATVAAQASVGIPESKRRVLSAPMVTHFAGLLSDANPEKAAKTLRAMADEFGPYWSKAFAQVSPKLDPAMRVAAVMDDPVKASMLLNASRQGAKELRQGLGVSTDLLKTVAQDDRMRDFRTAVSLWPGGGQWADALVQATEMQALSYKQQYGMADGEAIEAAIKDTFTNKYHFGYSNSRPFIAPRERDVSTVARGAREVLRSLTVDGLTMPQAPEGMALNDLKDSFLSAVKRNGFWTNSPDMSGLTLFSERGVPVLKNGKPIALKWDELEAMGDGGRGPVFQGGRYGFEPVR